MQVTIERGRFPVLRVSPCVPRSERSERRGPLFYVRADLEELLAFSGARCLDTFGGLPDRDEHSVIPDLDAMREQAEEREQEDGDEQRT